MLNSEVIVLDYELSFLAPNPFQTILELQKTLKFFPQRFEIFVCFRPDTAWVKKVKSTKNHF